MMIAWNRKKKIKQNRMELREYLWYDNSVKQFNKPKFCEEVSMDIGFKTLNGSFSLRSAALIIRSNQILLAKSEAYDYYYIVGGGIKENETSDYAVVRECYEETGLEQINFVPQFLKTALRNPNEIVYMISHE